MKNVLIIEDNPQNLYLMSFLLENAGYTVRSAVDGRGGIALAREAPPDLVLLDIRLPDMDGFSVARALGDIPALNGVPIIAVSSYAMLGDCGKALASGCKGYIEKPIEPVHFVEQIRALAAA